MIVGVNHRGSNCLLVNGHESCPTNDSGWNRPVLAPRNKGNVMVAWYELIVLLTDQTNLTVEELVDRLRNRFSPDPVVTVSVEHGDLIRVQWDDWSFHLSYESEPYVVIESAEIADLYASTHPGKPQIAVCKQRICMSGDDDPNMDHFNDFLFIHEVLESFSCIYLFDPQEGAFTSDSS